jgi:hypothetical protein
VLGVEGVSVHAMNPLIFFKRRQEGREDGRVACGHTTTLALIRAHLSSSDDVLLTPRIIFVSSYDSLHLL